MHHFRLEMPPGGRWGIDPGRTCARRGTRGTAAGTPHGGTTLGRVTLRELSEPLYRRFPELHERFDPPDPDLPYVEMQKLVAWLGEQGSPTPELIRRVLEFRDWCLEQPRGATASDDILTILEIAFYEDIIECDDTRAWITHLVPKEDLVQNRNYYVTWVGQWAFDLAIAAYDTARP